MDGPFQTIENEGPTGDFLPELSGFLINQDLRSNFRALGDWE
jgi:hypothetical protein